VIISRAHQKTQMRHVQIAFLESAYSIETLCEFHRKPNLVCFPIENVCPKLFTCIRMFSSKSTPI